MMSGWPRARRTAREPGRVGEEPRLAPTRADTRFELVSDFEPQGRPAPRDRRAPGGPRARRPAPGAPRGHRLRQDLHRRLRGRAGESPHPGPRPQQDARRAALPGVQGLLPRERRRVLRLLLRLLPARGLRAAVGHLHREGVHDQRGDRPAPPLRDAQPLRAPRRPDRGVRLLHLRPRLARGLLRDAPLRPAGGHPRPAGPALAPRGGPLRPQRLRAEARHLPGAGRRGRDRARLRGERDPHRAVRGRGGADQLLRPADREGDGAARPGGDLPLEPLRHAAAAARRRREDDRGGAHGGEAEAGEPGQAARGPAPLPAHHVRPRDAARDRPLPRHRELLAPPLRAASRASRRRRCSTTCRRTR